jgi:hypothetical protein
MHGVESGPPRNNLNHACSMVSLLDKPAKREGNLTVFSKEADLSTSRKGRRPVPFFGGSWPGQSGAALRPPLRSFPGDPMPLVVTCPGCSARLTVPPSAAGKFVKCPKCLKNVGVPTPEEPVPLPPLPAEPAPPRSLADEQIEEAVLTRKQRTSRDVEEDEGERGDEKPRRKRRRRRVEEDEDEESTSRKGGHKATTIVLIVCGAVALLCCVPIGGILVLWPSVRARTTEPGEVGGVVKLTDKQIVDFVDHPEKYKGQTLRLFLQINQPVGESLRNYAGQEVKLYSTTGDQALFYVTIKMPTNSDLPNVQIYAPLIVTFVCRDGKLTSGNEAIKVVRP